MSRNTSRQADEQPPVEDQTIEEVQADQQPAAIGEKRVGDVVDIPGKAPAAMVRTPDGSVTTVRGSYTVRHPGEHALIVVTDGRTTETTFTVTGK